MKFEVKNRWTGNVQFVAEIDHGASEAHSVKLGLAIKWAVARGADLSGADLSGADLSDADLSGADLRRADLSGAVLSDIKKDFFERLTLAKTEAVGLYDYLMRGKISGSCYEGACCCFCGTVAKVRHESYQNMTNGLEPDASSPTEKWFFGIEAGDTPSNNQVSAITAEWMREFMVEHEIVAPDYKLVSSHECPEAFQPEKAQV